MDNILLAQELVSGYNRRHLSSRCAIKVDIMKAFDSVNWRYLFIMMKTMGFPEKFLLWIRSCLQTAHYSFNINGSLCGFFRAKKGVRQGDPLSPYLFTIAMEGLSTLLREASLSGRVPFHPQCRRVALNHLCFADDLLIFTKGSAQAIVQVKAVLQHFYRVSGLNCNPTKCEIYFGGESVLYKSNALALSGFQEGKLPVRYLGLPLLAGKLSSSEIDILVDKITKRIRSWRAKKLTYAGRLQLLNFVILGIVQYWMQLFVLPKQALKRIQKICSQFLWHGTDEGRAKVAWEYISLPKQEGGLGVKDLGAWNQACSIRLLWLFLMNSGTLWVAWMNEYKCRQHDLWSFRVQYNSSWAWRKLLKLRDVISLWMKKQNGKVYWDSKEMMVYSIRRVWETLRNKAPKVSWYKLVWGRNCPPRFSLIVWLILKKAIITKDKLQKWGKIRDASCPLCDLSIESREHLFVHCSYSRCLAEDLRCNLLLHPDWETMVSAMTQVGSTRTRERHALLWCLLLTFIWKERCGLIHGVQRRPPAQVADLVRADLQFIASGNRGVRDTLVELGYL
ncbi:unnamed protein product [Linum trigynum]|uniref:Reverse transcriptase domain-containing protein n=1 Tax=Linum trigynum TaxID=586398 RepID=A0AAV2CR27_9ROSI